MRPVSRSSSSLVSLKWNTGTDRRWTMEKLKGPEYNDHLERTRKMTVPCNRGAHQIVLSQRLTIWSQTQSPPFLDTGPLDSGWILQLPFQFWSSCDWVLANGMRGIGLCVPSRPGPHDPPHCFPSHKADRDDCGDIGSLLLKRHKNARCTKTMSLNYHLGKNCPRLGMFNFVLHQWNKLLGFFGQLRTP